MVSRISFSRRRFLTTVTGGAALAAAGSLHLAPQAGARSTGYRRINASGVRLRSGPGTTYRVLASLALGTHVLYLDPAGWANGYEWAKVQVQSTGTVGYAAAQFLSSISSGGFEIGAMVHVDAAGGGSANLRSAPGTSAGVITTVRSGTTGKISDGPREANGYTWYKVDFHPDRGWMASVVLAAGGGSDRSWVRVSSGPLNVRQQPGTSSAIIGSAATGAKGYTTVDMPQEANGYTWANVQFESGLRGWVAINFLTWL